MKILQLASLIPYPVNDGGRVSIYNITKQLLKNGIEVHFAAPAANSNDVQGFSKLVTKVHLVNVDPKTKIWGAFKNLFNSMPYNISKYYSHRAYKQLETLMAAEHFNAIHVDSLHMAKYALKLKEKYNIPIVLREQNFESDITRRFYENTNNSILRYYAKKQYARILKYEAQTAAVFDVVIPITKQDELKLKRIAPNVNSITIPAGVNLSELKFTTNFIPDKILFLTNFEWLPNIDSFKCYVKSILPIILKINPTVITLVVGKGQEKIAHYKNIKGIKVVGFLDDLNSLSSLASIAVVPLKIGSGMRIKILELMAIGIVVVTTSIGAEGIEIENGKHAFVIDDPIKFAECIAYLLKSPEIVKRTAVAARALVEEKYSWDTIGDKFYQMYKRLLTKDSR